MSLVLCERFRKDQHVIEIYNRVPPMREQNLVHLTHEGCWSICQPEGYQGNEGCFVAVIRMDPNLVITAGDVELGEYPAAM